MNLSNTHGEREGVQHNYHDHSIDVDPGIEIVAERDISFAPGGAHPPPFPVRLHYVLDELAKDGLSHIASWQPHGRCFMVHDREKFVKSILPCWFAQNSFSSFQRQINIYNFKRLTHGPDKGAYYHELFLRGMRFLSYKIPRTKIKNNGHRRKASPDQEPNFYTMPYVPRDCSFAPHIMPQARSEHFCMNHPNMGQMHMHRLNPLPQEPLEVLHRPATANFGAKAGFSKFCQSSGDRQTLSLLPQSFRCDRETRQQDLDADLFAALLEPLVEDEPNNRYGRSDFFL